MKKIFHCASILAGLLSSSLAVIMNPDSTSDRHLPADLLHETDDEPRSFDEALRACFAQRSYGALECVNRGALTALQSWNDDECLDFGGVRLERGAGESRALLDLDWDPKDFGNVVRAASRLIERRNAKWDLGNIYPGLQMRVGPTLSAASGVLEFVMDERTHHHLHNRQAGTGRLLIRQLVLPFLLGFKFNLASLLPLLFGMLIIITKKALILTKIALFVAGLLGWNSLFGSSGFNSGGYIPNAFNGLNNYGYGNDHHHGGVGGAGGGGSLGASIVQDQNYPFQPYRQAPPPDPNAGFPFGHNVIREIVNVYETANQEAEESERRKKSFVWTRNDS